MSLELGDGAITIKTHGTIRQINEKKNCVQNIFYNMSEINKYRIVVLYLLHKGSKIYGYRVI